MSFFLGVVGFSLGAHFSPEFLARYGGILRVLL